MKFALIAAALIGAVVAQDKCISVALKVPTCAQSCLQSAGGKAGCGQLDFACQCESKAQAMISTLAEPCVLKACGNIQSALAVATSASAVCACEAANGAGAGGSSSAPSSAPASMTSAASMASSAPSSGSSAAASSPAMTSAAPSSAASAASAASSASSAPTSIQTGAAPTAGLAALGGFAAGILGVAALL